MRLVPVPPPSNSQAAKHRTWSGTCRGPGVAVVRDWISNSTLALRTGKSQTVHGGTDSWPAPCRIRPSVGSFPAFMPHDLRRAQVAPSIWLGSPNRWCAAKSGRAKPDTVGMAPVAPDQQDRAATT